jgi:hypothetical protein
MDWLRYGRKLYLAPVFRGVAEPPLSGVEHVSSTISFKVVRR